MRFRSARAHYDETLIDDDEQDAPLSSIYAGEYDKDSMVHLKRQLSLENMKTQDEL